MNHMAEMAEFLVEAGWVLARGGTKHDIWRCPCGQHQVSMSRPGGRGQALRALQITKKRVRQCAVARNARQAVEVA